MTVALLHQQDIQTTQKCRGQTAIKEAGQQADLQPTHANMPHA
jgi:hypothetical protein